LFSGGLRRLERREAALPRPTSRSGPLDGGEITSADRVHDGGLGEDPFGLSKEMAAMSRELAVCASSFIFFKSFNPKLGIKK
jgi:hypothetical protein